MKSAAKLPRGDPQRALHFIFDGWYNQATWNDFIDLLETLVVNAHGKKADGVIDADRFFAGAGVDTRGLRKRIAQAYVRERLTKAVSLIVENAREPLYMRTSNPEMLGPSYCMLQSNHRLGQFFTPWTVSLAMAQMASVGDECELRDRATSALRKAGLPTPRGDVPTESVFAQNLPALRETYEPIRMLEPCVGSGSMLLAYASTVPPWALDIGAVQITGIDLDPRAVQMCRINCLLYGVRARLITGNSLSMQNLEAVPPPYGSGYSLVRRALQAGDTAAAAEEAKKVIGYAPDFTGQEVEGEDHEKLA